MDRVAGSRWMEKGVVNTVDGVGYMKNRPVSLLNAVA